MRIRWGVIHRVARCIGYPYRVVFGWMGVYFMSDYEDKADYWSGFHALAGALIANVVIGYSGLYWVGFVSAFVVSFLWMLAYELLIDGLKIEDVRGAQQSDIGYNFMGAFLSVIAAMVGRWISLGW